MRSGAKGVLIGFLIGLIIFYGSYFLFICGTWLGGSGEGVIIFVVFLLPIIGTSYVTGIDILFKLFNIPNFFQLIIAGCIFALFFGLIGYLIAGQSRKNKIICIVVFLLIFSPLSIYSNYLKYNDNKILNENRFQGDWYLSSYEPCMELSIFNADYVKDNCLRTKLSDVSEVNNWKGFKNSKPMKDCFRLRTPSNDLNCIYYVAFQTSDVDVCNYIIDYYWDVKLRCISNIAVKLNDKNICSKPSRGVNFEVNSTIYSSILNSKNYNKTEDDSMIIICNTFFDICIPIDKNWEGDIFTETNNSFSICKDVNRCSTYNKMQFYNDQSQNYIKYILEKEIYEKCIASESLILYA